MLRLPAPSPAGTKSSQVSTKERIIGMGIFDKKDRHTAEREKLRNLHGAKKLQYIWDYYKLPLLLCGIVLYVIAYSIYGKVSHKDVILYTALVNVAAGEDLTRELSSDYLEAAHISPAKNEVYLYSGLYLTDDETNANHEYTYASRMKILAAIDAEQIDVVLMNREAFDAFSQNGYLCDLEDLLSKEDPACYRELEPYLITNTSILEDNSIDLYFDDSVPYQAETEEYVMGLKLSECPLIEKAGFNEPVYLGILSNSPRKEEAVTYLEYLYQSVLFD